MTEVQLKGGPHNGKTMTVIGYGLKVPLGFEYGWKFACGTPSFAHGMYLHDGSWQDAERDKVLDEVCTECEYHGTHDIFGGVI